jgi:hypothetical protein
VPLGGKHRPWEWHSLDVDTGQAPAIDNGVSLEETRPLSEEIKHKEDR